MAVRKLTLSLLCMIGVLHAGATRSAEHAHWAYTGHDGPAEWGAMDPAFASCQLGKTQSPIDIRDAQVTDLPAIKFDYKPSPLKIIDNGHTVQVNYAAGSSIDVGGMRYELVQFHFHHPSEEKIDGKAHEMVAHLVHKNAEGKLAVVAVLIDGGGKSELVDTLWKNLPAEKDKENVASGVTIDASKLLPEKRDYYTFKGSLTTPPCSEGVTWFVLKSPAKIEDAEIKKFAAIYPLNARPTQPLNGRVVQASK